MAKATRKKAKPTKPAETAPIIAYKGFDKDLKCRGFQYAIGEAYEHDGVVKACNAGFHACEHPLNVFEYYAPAGNRFAAVEQSGELSRHDGDTKVASSKITIKAEIGIPGLVQAAFEYVTSRCEPVDTDSPAYSTGDYGAASSTGYRGAASSTGDQGAASSTGNQGAASSTGNQGAASSTGYHSVAMACGIAGKAKASEGSAIVLCYRDADAGGDKYGRIVHIKAAIAGQDGIRPDVWYSLNEAGEFVEADE